jgi:glc operon protein GlcG
MTQRATRVAGVRVAVAMIVAGALVLGLGVSPAHAQAPPPYGPAITLEQAKKAMAAAEAEARKNNWNVVISIIDSAARLVLLQRLDNTQYGSIDIATGKATTAVNFRRPSKALDDAVAGGGAGLRLLRIDGLTPIEGGVPIVVGGKIIGGIGVSGVTAQQDAQIAKAGADAVQ